MQYSSQVIVKRWIPILKEYERTKAKVNPRPFKFVKTYAMHTTYRGRNLVAITANGFKAIN